MKYIPIIFSTPMVQAEQEDRKTETRRTKGLDAVNENPDDWEFTGFVFNGKADLCAQFKNINNPSQQQTIKCPYGKTAAVLWVRESFQQVTDFSKGPKNVTFPFMYKADGFEPYRSKWKPSIHMPKPACRIFLQIQDIQVQRLQDITEQDARNEGALIVKYEEIENTTYGYSHIYQNEIEARSTWIYAKDSFKEIINKINGPTSWDANPWVWVIKFKRIPKPENFC